MTIRVEITEGVFAVYDATEPEAAPSAATPYVAFWFDFATQEVFFFDVLLYEADEVGQAIRTLERDMIGRPVISAWAARENLTEWLFPAKRVNGPLEGAWLVLSGELLSELVGFEVAGPPGLGPGGVADDGSVPGSMCGPYLFCIPQGCNDPCCPCSGPCCNGICCLPGRICCGGSCCSPAHCCGGVCCNGPCCGGECCSAGPGGPCCNGTCCHYTEYCCAGECCPVGAGDCCEGLVCCLEPNDCCYGDCYPPGYASCGGDCCPIEECCVDAAGGGECCPPDRCCGGRCCPEPCCGGECCSLTRGEDSTCCNNKECCADGAICCDDQCGFVGACCFFDTGACTDNTTQFCCENQGGDFLGAGTICDPADLCRPQCENCHAVSAVLFECGHYDDWPSGSPCATDWCIVNVLDSATCDSYTGRLGPIECNTFPVPPEPEVVQHWPIVTTTNCEGGVVEWTDWHTLHWGCTACFPMTRRKACEPPSGCSGTEPFPPDPSGIKKVCGCP